MKCPNCGAEFGNGNVCEYCGSAMSFEMQKEHEQANKAGCPKCKSSNIRFNREYQGEVTEKHNRQAIIKTVGVCNDCGYTWVTDEGDAPKKKRTALWVLGWIFIFPVPLTIILLRKKDMNNILKYVIIAAAWAFYLYIGFSGNAEDANKNKPAEERSTTSVSEQASQTTAAMLSLSDICTFDLV